MTLLLMSGLHCC